MLSDGQGTTRATVDPVQAVTSTFTSDGFGNPVAQWGSSANPYRYAGAWGYRDDGDAGLLHVGARYYDPQVGRFISRDAVLSEHPYLYCEHEPIMRVDPSGDNPAAIALPGLLIPGVRELIIGAGIVVGVSIAVKYVADHIDDWSDRPREKIHGREKRRAREKAKQEQEEWEEGGRKGKRPRPKYPQPYNIPDDKSQFWEGGGFPYNPRCP
ncbi:MAG: RHS repeat-associated core domain-containing protein [Armatimonadota bacterium]